VLALKPVEDLPSTKKRRLELKIALQSAACSTFRACDVLGSILEQELGRTGFQMCRTKCAALMKKVLGPHFKDKLRKDLQVSILQNSNLAKTFLDKFLS
jgi:hypothetical protein